MTREYAIRYLSKKLKVAKQCAEDCETEFFETKSMYHTAVAVYEMAISALREQPRWISVEERLPEPFVSVLVYMPEERPLPTVHEGYVMHSGKWYAHFFEREPFEVTHWMPLPEPPKEEV